MRELLTMWRDTRMVMLVAVVAAVYAALLIPFKLFTILPGLTSIRPANVLPVFFGIAFGPAAAWGSAIGNLIGDVFGGTFGPGSIGGFVGNFFFGLVGYKLWGNLGPLSSGEEPDFRNQRLRQLIEYVAVAVAAAAACAAIIAWVVDALELVPFSVLGPIILTNNAVSAVVLGPPLFYLAYPRVKEMGLLYPDVLRTEDLPSRANSAGALAMLVVPLVWIGIAVLVLGGAPGSTAQIGLGAVGFLVTAVAAYVAGENFSAIVREA
ncbi:QueT transporter family protein [Halolamina litorea]|uniref:QueT transporter family protein n=1 Tax=Halolamina litorea TaxID=1515593 RepID=A0ABD6BPU3_9EURY|nr:QueT transporter family protein [Halolamina litorea]